MHLVCTWKICKVLYIDDWLMWRTSKTRRSEKDNRLETVRVSHWPITWLIYLPCIVAQGQSHCASNIIPNSHPFHSKWVDPPIPKLQQFQYLTLKIQGQGHGWGQILKSQYESNILSTHIPFVPCQSAIPFLRYDFFKIWSWKRWTLKVTTWVQHSVHSNPFRFMSICPPIPEIQHFQNLTLKIQGQGHGWSGHSKSQSGCNILSTNIPFVPCQSAIPFLRYDFFKFWPWKSKVKVMGEVDIKSHSMGPTFYRLTSLSFHVNRPFHSWDTAFSIFDLENPRSRSWMRWTLKVTK